MSYFEQRRQVVYGESQSLKVFLMSRLQPWRWPIMLANGGIRVERGGKPIDHLTLAYQLTAGDVVVIDDAYGRTWMELIKEATRDYHDLVFCPQRGRDAFLNNQVNALLLDPRAVDVPLDIKHLKGLIAQLTPLGGHPVRHLVLVSHANPYGDIMMPVRDPVNKDDTIGDVLNWESLKEAIDQGYFRIDAKDRNPTVLPRPEDGQGAFMPCALIIRGCSAGIHTILLKKIQEAFGYMIDTVVMPKYFNGADFIGRVSPDVYAAAVEYFMHRFIVTSKTVLDRKALLDAFKAARLTDWLGNPMPDGGWNDLLPMDVTRAAATKDITAKVDGRTKDVTLKAHYETGPLEPPTLTMEQTDKPDAAAIQDFFLKNWKALPLFQDTEFPFWKRLGLNSMEEFMAFWTFEIDPSVAASAGKWPVRAIRYEYEIRTPLIENGTLVCNYHPKGEKGTPSNRIDYNDDRIFGRFKHIPPHFAQAL